MKNILLNSHQLVQSLTKTEKRKIHLSLSKSNNNNHLFLLFKELGKLEIWDEKKLTVRMKKKGVKNYKILIHRLYKKLLSILFNHTQKQDKELELLASINHVYTLIHRLLYDSAFSLLKTIEKEAKEAALPAIVYQVITLKKRILIKIETAPKEVERCLIEEKEFIHYLETLNDVSRIRIQTYDAYISHLSNFDKQIETHQPILNSAEQKYPTDLAIIDYILDIEAVNLSHFSDIHSSDTTSDDIYSEKLLSVIEQKKKMYENNLLYKNTRKRRYINILINLSIRLQSSHPKKSLAVLKELIDYTYNDTYFQKHMNYIIGITTTRSSVVFLTHGLVDPFFKTFLETNSFDISDYPLRRQYEFLNTKLLTHWTAGEIDQALSTIDFIHQTKNKTITPLDLLYLKCYEGLMQLELENYLLLTSIIRQLKYIIQKETSIEQGFKEEIISIINFISFIEKATPVHSKKRIYLIQNFLLKHPNYTKLHLTSSFNFSTWINSLIENKTMGMLLLERYHQNLSPC